MLICFIRLIKETRWEERENFLFLQLHEGRGFIALFMEKGTITGANINRLVYGAHLQVQLFESIMTSPESNIESKRVKHKLVQLALRGFYIQRIDLTPALKTKNVYKGDFPENIRFCFIF